MAHRFCFNSFSVPTTWHRCLVALNRSTRCDNLCCLLCNRKPMRCYEVASHLGAHILHAESAYYIRGRRRLPLGNNNNSLLWHLGKNSQPSDFGDVYTKSSSSSSSLIIRFFLFFLLEPPDSVNSSLLRL